MDSADLKAGEYERRASVRVSRRISVTAGDGDDLGLSDAALVADGFSSNSSRPLPHTETQTPNGSIVTQDTEASSSDNQPPSTPPRNAVDNRPSSIAKPPRRPDSFALRHDGGTNRSTDSGETRSTSLISDNTEIRAESPYQGPSNPSHPYQMYPQNVRSARQLSVSTATTTPLPEPITGGTRPSHPYGLYPQQPAAAPAALPATAAGIAVGFPGLADRYQRRLGPDGEEIAGIIGPDGHTEELPPYTRYPDEAYARKIRYAGASVEALPASGQPPTAIPGAGGIGLATRNPEFEATDEPDSPRSRHSSRTFGSDASHHEINVAAASVSEKQKPLKKWQRFARKRMFGVVPYWAVGLALAVISVILVILGAVYGAYLGSHKKSDHHDPDPGPTVTVTYDAYPIPTPTDMPRLATGTFSMPFMSNRASSLCFNETSQSQSWNCNLLMFSNLTMTVVRNPPQEDTLYNVSINCNESLTTENYVYSYGVQPPVLSNSALQLVNDTFEQQRGPAWFKMMAYNKTIVLPETLLTPTQPTSTSPPARRVRDMIPYQSPGRKTPEQQIAPDLNAYRSQSPPPSSYSFPTTANVPASTTAPTTSSTTPATDVRTTSSSTLAAGSVPTTSTVATTQSTTSSSSASSSSGFPPGGDYGPATMHKSIAQAGDKVWVCVWPETFLELFIYPEQNSSFTSAPTNGSASAFESWMEDQMTASESGTPVSFTATPTFPSGAMITPTNMAGWGSMPPPYPRVVKVEERRVYDSPSPVCSQLIVQSDNKPALPALDDQGIPIVLTIIENEPPATPTSPSKRDYLDDYYSWIDERDVEEMSDCGCLWWIT